MMVLERLYAILFRMVHLTIFASWSNTIAALYTWRRYVITEPIAPSGAGSEPGCTGMMNEFPGESFWYIMLLMISLGWPLAPYPRDCFQNTLYT